MSQLVETLTAYFSPNGVHISPGRLLLVCSARHRRTTEIHLCCSLSIYPPGLCTTAQASALQFSLLYYLYTEATG